MSDPIARFQEVYDRARKSDPSTFDALSLATATADGRPSNRMVLLKSAGPDGFVIYTNMKSRKGREVLANPWAALCFFWPNLYEQVRVEGRVERVPDAEADAYFASRVRGSQIGAWASQQSAVLDHRDTLLRRVDALEQQYAGKEVPRPSHWSGMRVIPETIEFWQGQPNRLHIRTLYTREGTGWRVELLNP